GPRVGPQGTAARGGGTPGGARSPRAGALRIARGVLYRAPGPPQHRPGVLLVRARLPGSARLADLYQGRPDARSRQRRRPVRGAGEQDETVDARRCSLRALRATRREERWTPMD